MAPITKEAIEKLGKQLLAAHGFDPPIVELKASARFTTRRCTQSPRRPVATRRILSDQWD